MIASFLWFVVVVVMPVIGLPGGVMSAESVVGTGRGFSEGVGGCSILLSCIIVQGMARVAAICSNSF